MLCTAISERRQPQDAVLVEDIPYQLSLADVVPARAARVHNSRFTFGDFRLCLMRDFRDGAMATHPIHAAREALARIDLLDLWPHTAAGWLGPFGQFLIDLAPMLDDPRVVLGRPGVDAVLRMREDCV